MARSFLKSRKDFLGKIIEIALVSMGLLAVALIVLWLVKLTVGPANFPALTIVVAVTGAAVAVSQLSSAASGRFNAKARSLTFTTLLLEKAIEIGNGTAAATISTKAINVQRLRSISFAIEKIDPALLPSARAMVFLIEARSCVETIKNVCMAQDIDTVILSATIISARAVADTARDELARLYPVYNIGRMVIYTHGEYLPVLLEE